MTVETLPEPAPPRGARVALRVLQMGAVAVVLTATLHRIYELDRFLVAKELVLHVTAALAALFSMAALRRSTRTRLDLLLLLYLALSAVSALFATNVWLGARAFAVSASAVLVFWSARALREAGLARQLLHALALAVVLAAVTALMQAYGVRLDLFSVNRSPGGTLGNRNFVGHAAAFGLPVVMLVVLRATRMTGALLGSLGVAIVTAALVLTRSRAAWLACAAVAVVVVGAVVISRALRTDARTWRRLAMAALFGVSGLVAALAIPNTLRWRSDNPYLDSLSGVASYDEGSGRGRLVQYEQSLRMAAANPLLGVGPGNWPVVYPEHAARNDPSLDPSEEGMTFNPWPSSDWVAFVSERGPAAAIVLALFFAGVAVVASRRMASATAPDEAAGAAMLLAAVAGAVVTGLFDAVLLLALPTMLVWPVLGALWPATDPMARGPRWRPLVEVALLLVAIGGAVRSGAQVTAMELHEQGSLRRAAAVDPSNYRVQIRLARAGSRSQRCAHARAAVRLFPNAGAARSAARGCR